MRVIVADDHPLYLDAVRSNLERSLSGSTIIEARSFPAALEQLETNGPFDLVLLDFFMPGMEGDASIRQVVAMTKTPVVIMSGHLPADQVRACIAAGARAYLPKTLDAPQFAAAIGFVLMGGTYVPAELLQVASAEEPPRSAPSGRELSGRELEVLEQIVAGASNKEIARKLEIQEVTVKLHANRIFGKLGVRNRSQAAVKALDDNLVRRQVTPTPS